MRYEKVHKQYRKMFQTNYCGIIFFRVGSMFVGRQHFPGSWGGNFVGKRDNSKKNNIKQMLCICSGGCKFVDKGYPRKSRTLIPHQQC